MAALNKAMILGNVGRAPEVHFTQTGRAVANFSVATTDAWGTGDDRQERTEWHQVVVWGKLAETCGEYLTKGRQVMIEGRLQTRSYEDRDGNTRYVTEIVGQQVQFLGGSRDGGPTPEVEAEREPGAPPAHETTADQAEGEAEYKRAWAARQAAREQETAVARTHEEARDLDQSAREERERTRENAGGD